MEQNGKLKQGKESFVITLIGVVIHFALLYWGGFFNQQ
jgi:membrane protein involved in colicin uptake